MTIINGNGEFGGGIFNFAELTMNNVTFENNSASRRGGALTTVNETYVYNCQFIENFAPEGAAIYNEETGIYVGDSTHSECIMPELMV